MKIDIIVPAYKNLEEIKECIESVQKCTEKGIYNLIVINDCSPEEEVTEYLRQLEMEDFQLIENEQNLGFVQSVNKGMALSQNDVVLLNSDTVVTRNWLKNMIAAVESDKKVMCLNPTTNYKFCMGAIPYFRVENTLLEEVTIADMGVVVEKAGHGKVYRVPEMSGFCMYIRRMALEMVGYFDAETFGKGYGEETDFCEKVKLKGYYLGVVDNAYVYHKGGSSFGPEKRTLKNAHVQIIHERYPNLAKERLKYIIANPLEEFQRNVLELLYPGDESSKSIFEKNLNKIKSETTVQLASEMIFRTLPGGKKLRTFLKNLLKR